jgi:hypothetical protein
MLGDRNRESVRHGVPGSGPGRCEVNRVAPPLQPDLASHGLGNERQDVVEFPIEGIKRKKAWLLEFGSKKGAPITVAIALPDKSGSRRVVKSSLFCVI